MLKGAVTLVTGGAAGLGRATVKKFVERGAKVILCDLPTSKGNEVAKSLGDDAIFVPGDVTSETDVKTVIQTAISKFGRLDVTVNCAGCTVLIKTYDFNKNLMHSLDDFTRVLTVNTVGTFNVIRLSAEAMAQNEPNVDGQRGVIVNTAATSAFEGQIGQAAYAASKAAIVGMTLPIARDLSSEGIRVCTISPGLFNTHMLAHMQDKAIDYLETSITFPKRFGSPKEFALLVETIVDNPLLNGENICIDGALRLMP